MTSSLSGEYLNVNARRGVIINDTEELWRDGGLEKDECRRLLCVVKEGSNIA